MPYSNPSICIQAWNIEEEQKVNSVSEDNETWKWLFSVSLVLEYYWSTGLLHHNTKCTQTCWPVPSIRVDWKLVYSLRITQINKFSENKTENLIPPPPPISNNLMLLSLFFTYWWGTTFMSRKSFCICFTNPKLKGY